MEKIYYNFQKNIVYILTLLFSTSLPCYGKIKEKKKYHITFALNQNTSSKQAILKPELGINFLYKKNWWVGFSAGILNVKSSLESSLNFFEISQNIKYKIRLFHPIYALLGPSVSYLRPLEANKKLNLAKHKYYTNDFALSGPLSILIEHTIRDLFFVMSLKPWFAITQNNFRGFVISTSLGYSF